MNGHQQANRLKYSIILALGLSMAQIASAVGLGPIVGVNSHMGQPLNASIRVDNLSKEEAQSASVSLASAEEYRSRGIQRLPIHDQLRFKLTPSGNGYRIQVSSSKGIRDPFINFLLTINVGGQKITREYALFLNPDPAGGGATAAEEPTPIIAETPAPKPQTAAVTVTSPAPTPAPNTNNIALGSGSLIGQAMPSSAIPPASSSQEGWGGNTGNSTRVALQNQAQPAVQASGGKYTVKSGDTLYRIAQAATPRGGDVNAMMVAIQRANPHAFGNSNMNSLKAGATLTIPGSTVAVAETAPAEAAPRNTKRNRRQTPAPQTPSATEAPTAEEIAATPPAETPQTPPADMEGDEGAAPALTAEVVQDTGNAPTDPMMAEQTPESEPTTPPGMDTSLTLDGLDNVGNATADMLAQGESPSSDVSISTDLPQPDAPLEMPPSTDMTAQTAPVDATPPATDMTPSEPPAVSTPMPTATPPASTSSSALELPFGLQLWHLLLAGGLLVTAILLALLMKARRSRKRDDAQWDEMSPAELDRMASELESNPDLQRAFAGGLHDLDDLSYESLSQTQEKAAQPSQTQLSEAQLERERLKARMAELDALQAQQEQEAAAHDDFEQLQQKAAPTPSFDLHFNSTESTPKASETTGNNLFDDWDFDEQESTVQTSAHETNVDDFFNVDEKLEEVIKPASAVERVSFSRSDLQSAPASAAVATVEADPEKIEAMEINLDLATSFIATGNASRARVWLEEVLLEGSASQKALAAQLLKKVDAQK